MQVWVTTFRTAYKLLKSVHNNSPLSRPSYRACRFLVIGIQGKVRRGEALMWAKVLSKFKA